MCESSYKFKSDKAARLPVRQWVLSVPKRLRFLLHRDGAALHIGAVAFIHRLGSSLNAHVHFHAATSIDERTQG